MKAKIIILLSMLFLIINVVVYYVTQINAKHKIDIVLKNNLKTLSTHYIILNETQKSTAVAIYETTIRMNRVGEIIAEANSSTKEKKAQLREELHRLLKPMYKVIQKRGVLQYHFVLSNNESFYRAHKPNKFGDDLTDIRADYKYTNKNKKSIRGFTQGRTTHGFRNTFPLFDKNNKHTGAMEVSFSSTGFQWYLNNISDIHSHFLVDKSIFDAKTWIRDDLVLKYTQSAEAQNYMITLQGIHTKEECINNNRIKLQPIRKEINFNIQKGESFSSYVKYRNNIEVISFLPIRNLKNKTIAWIVAYEKSPIIKSAHFNILIIRIISFFISVLIIYFLIKQIFSKQEIKQQHKILNDILNLTDDIIFVTDFKDVKYSNNKFKNLLNIEHSNVFNHSSHHDILNIFVNADGYLHNGLLNKNENFVSLIARTPLKDRIVSIFDKNVEPKAFKISILESESKGDYLVSLSDITTIKEHQVQTEKKAYFDGLTKVYNRNKFDEIFEEELKRTKRYNNPLSVALLDIDKFKDFNDTYGHLVGDEVLITMAKTVNKSVRDTDIFARWGGEEFVILFKNTSVEKAKQVSEKLKDKIEENNHPTAGKITASFGLTQYLNGDTPERMFKRCDDALYIAKENGRNKVEIL